MTERNDASAAASSPSSLDAEALPVVLISFNRGTMLRKVVDGYRKQSVPVDLFVHDNGSDDPTTRDVLDQLEGEGISVFRRAKISSPEELNLVDETVQTIFSDRHPSAYAVSDCDISISASSPATLQTYLDLLVAMPDLECVGPMLRIDDVPPSYSLYSAMLNRHIGRFWSREPEWTTLNGRRVAYQRAPIDTTLAVYRAGEPFRRLRPGARMYHPFDARHLDWYPDEHADAYRASADGSTISNWSNPARERAHHAVPIKQTEYRTVVSDENGDLKAVTRSVLPPIAQPSLIDVVEGVRADLVASWPEAIGRAWVWRERAAVLETKIGSATQLAFDIVPSPGARWAIYAVARADKPKALLKAIGLVAEPDGRRHQIGTVATRDGGRQDYSAIAGMIDDILTQVTQ